MQAFAGRVREDINHRALQPAAWRVDDYLDLDDTEVPFVVPNGFQLCKQFLTDATPQGSTPGISRRTAYHDLHVRPLGCAPAPW